MAEAGPLVDAAEIREFGGDTWIVAFDETHAVKAELDTAREMLVLSTNLGTLPPAVEARALRLLLEVSAHWRDTGGLWMGLDAPADSVWQMCELPLGGLTPPVLGSRLLDFATLAQRAQTALASMAPPAELPDGAGFLRA